LRINQYSVSVMEIMIEDEEEFLRFIRPKLPLLKGYLLNLKGDVTPRIEDFLQAHGLQYIKNIEISTIRHAKKSKNSVEVYDRVIRSGEEISTHNSVICLRKVNDSALIRTVSNFIALGRVDGTIEANGDFLIFKKGPKGKIIFHNMILEDLEEGKVYKIHLENNEIIIEEIKEENGNHIFDN